MNKKKGFTIIELSSLIVILIAILLGTQFYENAIVKNQLKGAQLALMKLYKTEKLHYEKNKEYTDNLKILWDLHLRIPEYPVTIIDVKERSLKKDKLPIKYFRIGDYDIEIKISENRQNFNIKAKPINKYKEVYPAYSIDNNKQRKHPQSWTIKIEE